MRAYISHESPDETTPSDRYRMMRHDGRQSGENISLTYPDSGASPESIVKDVVAGWLNSSGHWEDLLATGWTKQGISVPAAQDRGLYTTQNFY